MEDNKIKVMQEKSKKNYKSIARELIEAIIIAIILALLIRKFVIQAYKIPSGSMLETLKIGDHILVNKFIYFFREPQRGDILVFKYPKNKKRDFIKRLIGLPGETIEIRDKKVFINGKPLDEPYVKFNDPDNTYNENHPAFYMDPYARNRDNYGPKSIPEGTFFMMGDNRDFSQDSRYWGILDRELIEGKALIIYFSFNKNEKSFLRKVRWNRIGELLH